MGNCCQTQVQEKYDSIANIKLEQWYIGNDFFDGISFNRRIQQDENNSFQKFLRQAWKNKDLHSLPLPRSQAAAYSIKNRLEFHYLIQKGVPNFLIRDVILKLVPFDDDNARHYYGEMLESLEPLPDFMNLPATLEPLFGRKDLENVYLTGLGIMSLNRVLYVLRAANPDCKVCLLLPRVCQMLFWFLKEHEAFQVLHVLINESKARENCDKYTMHFPFGLDKHKEIVKIALFLIDSPEKKYLKRILKDSIFNFLVGYISPSFYPIVLMYFMADGINGLLRLVVTLFKLSSTSLENLFSANNSNENIIQDSRQLCEDTVGIASLMKNAFKLELNFNLEISQASVIDKNDLIDYTPIFNGGSKILESSEEIRALCSNIPEKFLTKTLNLEFSINKTGFDSEKFVAAWKAISGPLVLLVETYKKRVVGVFLEKNEEKFSESESCLFVMRPEIKVFRHVSGEKISIYADLKNGLRICEEENNEIFVICASLSNAINAESKVFCSTKLAKSTEFLIYDLELFSLV